MKFQIKIMVVTIVIMVTTLSLSSILSLSSFEKIFVSSLVSTYEIAGKNLKRKIDQSLRLGKPLDNFEGMDRLMGELIEKNPDISEVCIATIQGKILYSLGGKIKNGDTISYQIPNFDKKKNEINVQSKLIKGMYVTFLPLYDSSEKFIGTVYISFSREVIYKKLTKMATESLKILIILIFMTSGGLIIFIAFLIVRPIKQNVANLSYILKWPDENLSDSNTNKLLLEPDNNVAEYMNLKNITNELDRLGWYIQSFVNYSHTALKNIENLKQLQKDFFLSGEKLYDFESSDYKKVLSENEKLEFQRFIDKSEHFSEILYLLKYISDSLKDSMSHINSQVVDKVEITI